MLECVNRLDKKSYAIKVTRGEEADALREVENLVQLPHHDNLVRYITCWKDSISRDEINQLKNIAGFLNAFRFVFVINSRHESKLNQPKKLLLITKFEARILSL